MEYWEFLIQREGDREWRSIKTGNLQLTEGKYRIVANSHLLDTPIQTRVTHQTLGSTLPQRRSQSRDRATNAKGFLVIIPFTQLSAGIWQFVCSGATAQSSAWHQILKLRVLPRTPKSADPVTVLEDLARSPTMPTAPIDNNVAQQIAGNRTQLQIQNSTAAPVKDNDSGAPTEPLVPISSQDEPENWAQGLDRLLEQLERDSLQSQPRQSVMRETFTGAIRLNQIVEPPSQLISLNRSTFSGMIPGTHLTIVGTCNLQRLSAKLLQTVKVEKLSICLRHPQTSEIIGSIERSLPANFDTFVFNGQIALPTEPKSSLLLGEVNLYDKHHIQVGSSGFTITLNLNPQHESELSLLQLLDVNKDTTAATLDRLTQELQREAATIGASGFLHRQTIADRTRSTISPLVPDEVRSEDLGSFLCQHPDIHAVDPGTDRLDPLADFIEAKTARSTTDRLQPQHSNSAHPLTVDITGDLDLDLDRVSIVSKLTHSSEHSDIRTYPNLEIVVDD